MKNGLRLLCLVVLCLALVLIWPNQANAASESDLTFTLNSDGQSYSVTGCSESATGELVIPKTYKGMPVTGIGNYAFSDCTGLTAITIPDGVTSIDTYAFYGCSKLTSITIPDSVTSIGNYAFQNCTRLTSVTIGNSVTSIGSYAFLGCTRLVYNIYDNGKYLGNEENPYFVLAGTASTSITSCAINENTKIISYNAFENCTGLTAITIPDSVTNIGNWAFKNCTSLTSITISNGVASIGGGTFSGCTGLTSITIPDSVTGIGDYAFRYCEGLTSITIPTSVTSIGSYAFQDCTGLTSITIPNGVASIGGGTFSGCTGLTAITIPDSVTSIGNSAFRNCTDLTSITIPNSVTSIGNFAFDECISLVNIFYSGTPKQWAAITIGSNNQYLTYAILNAAGRANGICGENLTWYLGYDGILTITGNGAMYDYKSAPWYTYRAYLKNVVIPDGVTGIGSYAFYDCTGLTSVTIGDSVTSIGDYAFSNCTGLTSVTISDSVTSIGDYAFSGCTGLTSITIPDSVTSIGNSAFQNCTGLTSITIPDSVTSIGDYAFYYCTGLTSITIPDSVASIGSGTFYGCSKLTSVTIPDSVTSIGNWAFRNCTRLTSVTIGDSVTSIGNYAFYGCTGLTSITIPDSVTSIGNWAFQNCTRLTLVTIGDSVTSIGNDAFSGCTRLVYNIYDNGKYLGNEENPYFALVGTASTSITSCEINENTKIISACAFENCIGLTAITIPDSVTGIGNWAFKNCTSLTAITIPDSVASIGSGTFSGCTGLTAITIPDSVTSIGDYAFDKCSSLANISYGGTRTQWAAITIGSNNTYLTNATLSVAGRKNGTCGENLTWYLGDDGTLTITGNGAMDDYTSAAAPWYAHRAYLENVVIPDGVTGIGSYAFQDCTGLTSVTIPDSVTSIGNWAFKNCTGLTSITIPDSVASIGGGTFSGCTGLTSITIPNSVTSIGNYAFDKCSSLANIFYSGTRTQWDAITIGSNNTPLTKATLQCILIAQEADGTLVLKTDGQQASLEIAAGQVLDLNGHTLTVDSLASFGQIIDSVGGGGLIATNIEITSNDWLPVQDSTGCYRFYEYEVANLGAKDGADSAVFGFALDFADAIAYTRLLESDDVQVTVTLAVGGTTKTFAFSREMLHRYAKLQLAFPDMQAAMKLHVTGLDTVADGTVITVTPSITAVGGKIQNSGDAIEYIV